MNGLKSIRPSDQTTCITIGLQNKMLTGPHDVISII